MKCCFMTQRVVFFLLCFVFSFSSAQFSCVLCIVYCVLCIVYCVLCIVYCALCIVLCVVRCALCVVRCALCVVRCALCVVRCALCVVRCVVCPPVVLVWMMTVTFNTRQPRHLGDGAPCSSRSRSTTVTLSTPGAFERLPTVVSESHRKEKVRHGHPLHDLCPCLSHLLPSGLIRPQSFPLRKSRLAGTMTSYTSWLPFLPRSWSIHHGLWHACGRIDLSVVPHALWLLALVTSTYELCAGTINLSNANKSKGSSTHVRRRL